MAVTAKFKCIDILHGTVGSGAGVTHATFDAVIDSPENKELFANTPSGRLVLGAVNPASGIQFELGAEYLLTIEKVPAA